MKKNKKFIKAIFPKPINMGKRNWGTENILVVIPKVLTLKILEMKKGKKGGLQYHHLKNECGYILSGKLLIRYENRKGVLKKKVLTKGKCFHFPRGAVHQEEALTKVRIIEASSPHYNDRVRVENLYNLEKGIGLSSTKIKEVKIF